MRGLVIWALVAPAAVTRELAPVKFPEQVAVDIEVRTAAPCYQKRSLLLANRSAYHQRELRCVSMCCDCATGVSIHSIRQTKPLRPSLSGTPVQSISKIRGSPWKVLLVVDVPGCTIFHLRVTSRTRCAGPAKMDQPSSEHKKRHIRELESLTFFGHDK